MRRFSLNSTLFSLHLLLFSLFFICNDLPVSVISTQLMSDESLEDKVCELICGQGTCKIPPGGLGIDCECKPGWKKIQIPPSPIASCVIPNCTIDFQCGNGSPPPPPPPPPPPSSIIPPFANLSNPCALKWCGDGNCVANETEYRCQCNQGSANLFNNTAFACFKQCNLGIDCSGLGLALPASPPPPAKSASPQNGPASASNCSRNIPLLTMILLSTIFLA